MSEAEVEAVVAKIIADNDASGMAAMGKVMGLASAELAGKADGKTISTIVKKNYYLNFYSKFHFLGVWNFKLMDIDCVVQLDRISDFDSEGCRFEPCRGHIKG